MSSITHYMEIAKIYLVFFYQAIMTLMKSLSFKSILYHLLVIISYILCFVYLYRPNTEMISVVLFFVLHICVLSFIVASKVTIPNVSDITRGVTAWDITQIFNINYTEYSLGFVTVHWVLLLFALYWLVVVYVRLYNAYIPVGKDMTFGKMETTKTTLFRYLITSTLFMWLFYVIQNIKHMFEGIFSKNRILNSFVLVITVLSVMNSIYAFQLSKDMYDKTHTINVPRSTS